MKKNIKALVNQKLQGQIGENAVWDGPLSKEGFPMGVGSSSGITGMQVSKAPCGYGYQEGPISSRAKVYK
jgi:hypothetical protein